PGVDGAGEQSSVAGDERDLRLLEQPLDLRRREIGIRPESGPLGDEPRLVAQLLAPLGSASILPDDRARQWLSGIAMPENDRFALIGDADDVRSNCAFRDCIARRLQRAIENLLSVVLHPTRLRIMLGDLVITSSDDASIGRDDE